MNRTDERKLERALHKVFGLESLRPAQKDVIEHVLRGRDVLAIMPTGAGKSLCYQLPGLQLEGMTVVVSPLISLMKDQTDKLEEIGLDTANLNSSVSAAEQNEALEEVKNEESDFIFTTPERLTNGEFLKTVKSKTINFVVIDEAHCISQWGHDFRPAFLELREALRQLGDPSVLALTATATPDVIEDIKKQLGRPKMEVVRGGIYRDNLHFSVIHTTSDQEKRAELRRLLRESRGSKIVYCATVKAVDEVTEFLRNEELDVEAYHGKMTPKQRSSVQDRFMSGELGSIVATNAFGMGVDKPDIRSVIHWQMPGSLEAYYQEAGRAGRDGKTAECVLLYDTRDRRVQQFFLGGKYPTGEDVWLIYRAMQELRSGGNKLPNVAEIIDEVGDAVSKNKVRVTLNLLKEEKVVKERRGARFELVRAGAEEDEIRRTAESYAERGMSDRDKLERMMLYAQSGFCRWHVLEEYFDTTDEIGKCGTCDNCKTPAEERLQVEVPQHLSKKEESLLLKRMQKINGGGNGGVKAGDMVELPKFGEAQVEDVHGDKVDVVLPDGSHRTFKDEFVEPLK